MNLAEPGMNAVQQVSRLDSEGLAYGPDVVVLAYVLNDSEDEDAAEARRAADWAEEEGREQDPVDRFASTARRCYGSSARGFARPSRTAAGSSGYRSMYADGYAGWTKAARPSSPWAGCAGSAGCRSWW